MATAMRSARHLAGAELAAALNDARDAILAAVLDLDDTAWLPEAQGGVNPIAWELGHLAWFAEFWILRGPHRRGDDGFVHAARPARIAGADALFDSARLGHAQRWTQAWPTRQQTLATLEAQLAACVEAIPADGDDASLYFHRLVLFHEDMHAEAFRWLRAALGHGESASGARAAAAPRRDLAVAGATVALGRPLASAGFAFDNEQPGATVELSDFAIDSQPVSNADFAAFVDAGGYAKAALWPTPATAWRETTRAEQPSRWRRVDGAWHERWFDRWRALPLSAPVIHINAWEAEAWCRWAGRRLPHAAEWEHAARSARGFAWGKSVWEWTADAFLPYPGFVPGPYRDYSAPWFGNHRELRGGSFATQARLHDAAYRNFFSPERNDVFAGFRSAAP